MKLTDRQAVALAVLVFLFVIGIVGWVVQDSYNGRTYETRPAGQGCTDTVTIRPWDNKVMAHHVVCGRP